MSDAHGGYGAAHEAARALAAARWRGQVVGRAVETIQARRDELSPEQLAALRELAGDEQETDA